MRNAGAYLVEVFHSFPTTHITHLHAHHDYEFFLPVISCTIFLIFLCFSFSLSLSLCVCVCHLSQTDAVTSRRSSQMRVTRDRAQRLLTSRGKKSNLDHSANTTDTQLYNFFWCFEKSFRIQITCMHAYIPTRSPWIGRYMYRYTYSGCICIHIYICT